jgi:hypothetical protein
MESLRTFVIEDYASEEGGFNWLEVQLLMERNDAKPFAIFAVTKEGKPFVIMNVPPPLGVSAAKTICEGYEP